MKAIVAIALADGLFVAPSTTASAADRTDVTRTAAAHVATAKTSAASITDFTAKRRKHRAVAVAPLQMAPAHSGWTGPDPSKGPGIAILRQLQRDGRCVIDEGYGRYTFCSNM